MDEKRLLRVKKKICDRQVIIDVPFGKKKEATQLYDEIKEEIFNDVVKNPRKWLDKVSKKKTTS